MCQASAAGVGNVLLLLGGRLEGADNCFPLLGGRLRNAPVDMGADVFLVVQAATSMAVECL